MNKKRGFTLIEIIICIALIAIIGTTMTLVVIKSNKNKQIKILENNNKILENALEVYLEKHEEIQTNLENNAKGAIVTLEVLKNEGLIDEKQFKGVELKKNYFFLSYSMLDSKPNTDCENNVIPLSIVENWKVDTNKVVYICPKKSETNTITIKEIIDIDNSNNIKDSLILSSIFGNMKYVAQGENPDNWVTFEVENDETKATYWPKKQDENEIEEKDLWRIVYIDNEGYIKLLYNNNVVTNNKLLTNSNEWKGNEGYTFREIYNEGPSEKINILYEKIKNKNYIEKANYFYNYGGVPAADVDVAAKDFSRPQKNDSKNLLMSTLTMEEYNNSFDYNNTWIDSSNGFMIGTANDTDYSYNVYLQSGNALVYKEYNNSSKHWNGCNYRPVITLKKNVTLEKNTNCESNDKQGSKKCPFIVKCDDC